MRNELAALENNYQHKMNKTLKSAQNADLKKNVENRKGFVNIIVLELH